MVAWMACGRLPAREAPEVRADVSLWCANCALGWPTFLAPVTHGVHVPFDSECSAPRGVPTPERDPYIGGKLNA